MDIDEPSPMKAFTTFNIGASCNLKAFMPSLSLAERFDMGWQAFEIAFGSGFKKDYYYFYTPRLMYLYFFNEEENNSCFLGGGLSWMFLKQQGSSHQKFNGIGTHLAGGIELSRQSSIKEIIQLTISQPTIPSSRSGDFPLPIIELSLGLGF